MQEPVKRSRDLHKRVLLCPKYKDYWQEQDSDPLTGLILVPGLSLRMLYLSNSSPPVEGQGESLRGPVLPALASGP